MLSNRVNNALIAANIFEYEARDIVKSYCESGSRKREFFEIFALPGVGKKSLTELGYFEKNLRRKTKKETDAVLYLSNLGYKIEEPNS